MINKFLTLSLFIFLVSAVLVSCTKVQKEPNATTKSEASSDSSYSVLQESSPSSMPTTLEVLDEGEKTGLKATIKTVRGDIVVKLNKDIAPKTVLNFTSKSKEGYYNNLMFHRVESWVIQGGDPLGNGTGGGDIETELSKEPFKLGSLGVARAGNIEISNDSQFFICTDDCSWLTGQYTNFGEVVEGLDVAKTIKVGDKIISIEIE